MYRAREVDDIFSDIISGFGRLDRKPSNLLKSIEHYQKRDIHLYFKKQNLWVKDKSDIASQIMISVLAVMSQYEIELFVARGIDGKIFISFDEGKLQFIGVKLANSQQNY